MISMIYVRIDKIEIKIKYENELAKDKNNGNTSYQFRHNFTCNNLNE